MRPAAPASFPVAVLIRAMGLLVAIVLMGEVGVGPVHDAVASAGASAEVAEDAQPDLVLRPLTLPALSPQTCDAPCASPAALASVPRREPAVPPPRA